MQGRIHKAGERGKDTEASAEAVVGREGGERVKGGAMTFDQSYAAFTKSAVPDFKDLPSHTIARDRDIFRLGWEAREKAMRDAAAFPNGMFEPTKGETK